MYRQIKFYFQKIKNYHHDMTSYTYDKVLMNIFKKPPKTKTVAICTNITLIYCFKALF